MAPSHLCISIFLQYVNVGREGERTHPSPSRCVQYIKQHTSEQTVCRILKTAERIYHTELVQWCSIFIAERLLSLPIDSTFLDQVWQLECFDSCVTEHMAVTVRFHDLPTCTQNGSMFMTSALSQQRPCTSRLTAYTPTGLWFRSWMNACFCEHVNTE